MLCERYELLSRHFLPICSGGYANHLAPIQLKQAFDPLCLLNCDKVVRMEKPKAGEVAEW